LKQPCVGKQVDIRRNAFLQARHGHVVFLKQQLALALAHYLDRRLTVYKVRYSGLLKLLIDGRQIFWIKRHPCHILQ